MHNVKEAYNDCENIIAYHSKTFYKAFSLLPERDRQAVWAVYAFCRTVDDIVDEGSHPESELARFSLEFGRFLKGEGDWHNPMWVALHDVFQRYEMDAQPFWDLIKGQEMDLVKNRYETMEELLHYCYHVASTVGLMLLPILAPTKVSRLKHGAIALGLAMQLTNVLRDVGDDLQRNRIYLPNEIMARYGLTEEMLFSQTVDRSFIQAWEHIAGQAEQLYEEAFLSLDEYPLHSQIAVKGAAYLYRKILAAIRTKQYRVFNEKQFVSDEEKQVILASL